MVNSIRDLIVALSCVAMLNVAAASAQVRTVQDLPVAGGWLKSMQQSLQQPAGTPTPDQLPLKMGGAVPPATRAAARIQDMPEYQTTVVYLGDLPLLSVATAEEPAILRASLISSRVNQLQWDQIPGESIRITHDGKSYSLVAGKDQTLITIDRSIRLSRTEAISDKAAALQIANRLRRYFGNAPELTDAPPEPPSLIAAISVSISDTVVHVFQGVASWYGHTFLNRRTSSGTVLREDSLIAAHPALPFGTQLRVTNLGNGRQVTVKVQDRGPFIRGRVIDLSPRAAQLLGMVSSGLARVKVEVIR